MSTMKRKNSDSHSPRSSKSPRSLISPSAKRLSKRQKIDSSSQPKLDSFFFSVKGKSGGDVDKKSECTAALLSSSSSVETQFQMKNLYIRLVKNEVEIRMKEMANETKNGEKKRRSKVILKYDNGDDDGDDDDLVDDKENIPVVKKRLTVKMPFHFGAKSKKGRVKDRAKFLGGESEEKDETKKMPNGKGESGKGESGKGESVKGESGDGKTETSADGEQQLDENGNVKPKSTKNEDNSDSESDDSDDDDDDIVKRREKNLLDNQRMLKEMMASFDDKCLFKPASMRRTSLPSTKASREDMIERRKSLQKRRQSFAVVALQANRKSPPRTRSKGVDGEHAAGLKDEETSLRRRIDYNENLKVYFTEDDEDDREAEGVVKPEATRRRYSTKRSLPHVILPVEEVTASLLSKISTAVLEKVYDPINGTSCHQCRQKTKDTKTCCRAPDCFGVRGQFCGVCLKNRYGENAADALLDPDWKCPPCRGICNCSICRSRSGRCPTGILFQHAEALGYKSVHHFLAKKGEEGEVEEEGEDSEKKE